MDDHNVQQDKRKTSTFTLRIDEDIIKSLQNESRVFEKRKLIFSDVTSRQSLLSQLRVEALRPFVYGLA